MVLIRDTRYLVNFNENKVIDKVLSVRVTIPVESATGDGLEDLLKKTSHVPNCWKPP
jgi:hypothetical protein